MNTQNKFILSFLLIFPIILSLNINDLYIDFRISLIKICLSILFIFGLSELLMFIIICIGLKLIKYHNPIIKDGLINKWKKEDIYDEYFIKVFERI